MNRLNIQVLYYAYYLTLKVDDTLDAQGRFKVSCGPLSKSMFGRPYRLL